MKHSTELTQMAGFDVIFTRKRVRNINLRVRPSSGAVVVSAPHRLHRKFVEEFIHSRTDWIKRAQQRVATREVATIQSLQDGARVDFLGEMLSLKLEEGSRSGSVECSGALLIMRVPKNSTEEKLKALLESFYRRELQKNLMIYYPNGSPLSGQRPRSVAFEK